MDVALACCVAAHGFNSAVRCQLGCQSSAQLSADNNNVPTCRLPEYCSSHSRSTGQQSLSTSPVPAPRLKE